MMSAAPLIKPAYSIREMAENDIQQVVEIDQLSFSLPWPARSFRYELSENENSLLWVAESATPPAQILGFIVVWLILDEAHIATIAVHPEHRQQGVGRQLLITAAQECIRRGSNQMTLEVRSGNLPAQALYQQFNFTVAGIRPRYYQDNQEDAFIMTATRSRLAEALGMAVEPHLNEYGTPEYLTEEVV